MQSVELVIDTNTGADGYNGIVMSLNRPLLLRLLVRSHPDHDDVAVLAEMLDLIRSDLAAQYAERMGMALIREAGDQRLLLRVFKRICDRCKILIEGFDFRDYREFGDHLDHVFNGNYGSADVRQELKNVFDSLEDELWDRQYRKWDSQLLDPVSPHGVTGWDDIDTKLAELRSVFRDARSADAHSAVGNLCIRIIETLGDQLMNILESSGVAEDLPSRGQFKDRVDLFIAKRLSGSDNSRLRAVAKTTVELAQDVKHRRTPGRIEAGIAADTTIALVHMMRRLAEPTR